MGASHAEAGSQGFGLGTLARGLTERRQLLAILIIALLQGLLFVFLVPPWQHYDEPTHFEYAWLIAQLGRRPYPGDESAAMRREVQASMAAHGYFAASASLVEDDAARIQIGISELGHPPGYYTLAALPIAVFRHLDVTSQLYLARLVSVCLFLLTVVIAWGITRDLTAPDSPLRWSVPLIVALLPSFADVMSSVNNDVGAVFASSLFIWGAVRLIMYGFNWRRLAWIVGAALLGALMKNTAMYGLVLMPAACLFAFWGRRGWRMRWLGLGLLGLTVALLCALFGWGDAALWYRHDTATLQIEATREQRADAPHGTSVFILHPTPSAPSQGLLYPLRADDVQRIAGRAVTLGAWIWADRAAQQAPLGLMVGYPGAPAFQRLGQPVQLTTTPTFVAQTFELPEYLQRAQVSLSAALATPQDGTLRVYADRVILAEGAFDTASVPLFSPEDEQRGSWDSRPFVNLIGNASAEQSWPRPRTELDDRIRALSRHRLSQTLLALIDAERTGRMLLTWAVPIAVDGLTERLAWGQVRLHSPPVIWLVRGLLVLSIVGCLFWTVRHFKNISAPRRAALTFCALSVALIWGAAIVRPLPTLSIGLIVPATRYAFPAIVPTVLMLVSGWLVVTRKPQLVALLVGAVLILNIASVITLKAFFGAG